MPINTTVYYRFRSQYVKKWAAWWRFAHTERFSSFPLWWINLEQFKQNWGYFGTKYIDTRATESFYNGCWWGRWNRKLLEMKPDCIFSFFKFFVSGLLYAECFKRPESLHADCWNSILLNTWNELSWFLDRRNGRAPHRRVSGVVLISNCILVHQSAHRAEL